ncbi:hypothetical protein NC652_033166 [Populus alba x Populus x berolinensis]|nr:hypothetical protein NC652_033166 [Populus alba x Populus x berolinensis]
MPCIGLLPLFRRPDRGLLFLRIPSLMTMNLFLLNSIPTSPTEIVCGFGCEGENWNYKGETLLFWYGPFPIITIADPEQVLSNKLGLYIKPSMRYPIDTLPGKGLVLLNAQDWARHRTILNNGFSMDKLKVSLGKLSYSFVVPIAINRFDQRSITRYKTREFDDSKRPKSLHWPQFRNVGNENSARLLLQMFSFSLSPEYKHRPLNNL